MQQLSKCLLVVKLLIFPLTLKFKKLQKDLLAFQLNEMLFHGQNYKIARTLVMIILFVS